MCSELGFINTQFQYLQLNQRTGYVWHCVPLFDCVRCSISFYVVTNTSRKALKRNLWRWSSSC